MTRSVPAYYSIIIAFAAVVSFALPAFADQNNDWNWRHRNDRTPSCWMTVSPSTVAYGGSTTLSWGSEDADRVEISDIGGAETEGHRTLSNLTSTKTFHMTVYAGSESANCETTVNVHSQYGQRAYPSYPQYFVQPSCVIKLTPTQYSNNVNGVNSLSWHSNNASSAYLSPEYKSVPVNDVRHSYGNAVYTLTVYGPGGIASCSTNGQVSSGTYQYLSLTQIPYTGFDFGPFGNAMYWTALLTLALGVAYILVYQQGFRALASVSVLNETLRAGKMQYAVVRDLFAQEVEIETPVTTESTPTLPTETLVASTLGNDTMEIIEGDTPRIVISRN